VAALCRGQPGFFDAGAGTVVVGGEGVRLREFDLISHAVLWVNSTINSWSRMRSTVTKPNLIYDMGLHKGEDTDFYLRKGFDVIAFEANPELVQYCKLRFADHVAAGRLTIVDGAIAPRSAGTSIEFYRNSNTVWGTIKPDWAKRNEVMGASSETISVSRVDIQEIFTSMGIPFYLKIDLEGVDGYVLETLSQFGDRPQYISMESEKVDFAALRESLELLARLGYTKFKIVDQSTLAGSSGSFRAVDNSLFSYTFPPDTSGPFGEEIPQPWVSFSQALSDYRLIFWRYRWFGDKSLFARLPWRIQHWLKRTYQMATGSHGGFVGWHDIHASL
jgi:FkbM family methyltransferase